MRVSSLPTLTPIQIQALIDIIKRQMPTVYGMVTDKAAEIGNDAYAHVRAGLRGEPNRFYAFEAGWVVGTPFNCPDITEAVAGCMVRVGVAACTIWPDQRTGACTSVEAAHGTH